MDPTKERIYDGLRILLASGGPFSAVVLRYTEMNETDWNLLVQLLLFVVPPVAAWAWGLYLNSMKNKVQAVAAAPPEVVQQALTQVSDTAKVLIAQAVPDVATVVVKDNANGSLGVLAQSQAPEARNIVTEAQNELDAKRSSKSVDQLEHEIQAERIRT